MLLGLVIAAVASYGLVLVSLFGNVIALVLLMVLVGNVFALVAAAVGLLVVGAALLWVTVRIARALRDHVLASATPAGIAAMILSATAVALLAAWLAPEPLRDVGRRVAAGRMDGPVDMLAVPPERQRRLAEIADAGDAADAGARTEYALALRHGVGLPPDPDRAAVLLRGIAAEPDGIEARLVLALEATATPMPAGGGAATQHIDAKVAALEATLPGAPPGWAPLVHAMIAEVGPGRAENAGRRGAASGDALRAAGKAGSIAFTVHAAELDEGTAMGHERPGARQDQRDAADAAWRSAHAGFAAAGMRYELGRMALDGWPARLGPMPEAGAPMPHVTDAALAARLWRLVEALHHPRATSFESALATHAGLYAFERTPDDAPADPSGILALWDSGFATSRWVLARRHARGDCAAALVASHRVVVRARNARDARATDATPFDFAWSQAWAERAEACETDPVRKREAAVQRANMAALNSYTPGQDARVARARADIAAWLATLR